MEHDKLTHTPQADCLAAEDTQAGTGREKDRWRFRFWRSVFREPVPRDRKGRLRIIRANFFLHLHPTQIRKHALYFRHTWCMGGIAFLLFLVEVVTGVALMFYYRPTVEHAYLDMVALREVVSLGFLREVHRWGGHAMVGAVWLHMLRVFLTGSYKPPREFNWVVGVLLLLLTMGMAFTGYLLPWDQLSLWAVTVASNMAAASPLVGHEGPGSQLLQTPWGQMITQQSDTRFILLGAPEVAEETLNRFYILHCVALPILATVLMGVHFWRVRKDGGISGPL
ncbi:MAG: cytochrome b N-terminal domain-containing protein [Thermoguttaceae bacterium]|nr:cytochrome b N-terminal domain-containing protein [Thermoguttaceae bacterium]MDW8077415.1 cytochrome b N-terminal domain-containing protein [Thermoguttaceae bacterium]